MRAAGVVADALIVDAPYSVGTHDGHDGLAASTSRRIKANGVADTGRARREIEYPPWTKAEVAAFVSEWNALVDGWIASITDDVLFQHWRDSMEAGYRCTFQDVPAIIGGMTVRLCGGGPSSWAVHIAVGRPRSARWAAWSTLPGGYHGPSERGLDVVGGKPLWLMRRLVSDYSAPGDLVVDPCMGGGTTLVAAIELGRIAVGCEPDAGRYEIARSRCAKARPQLRMALDVSAERRTQSALDLTTEEP